MHPFGLTLKVGIHMFPNEKSSPFSIFLNLGLPIYYGMFGIPHITVYCGIATVSWHHRHSQNRRLFRFARVSRHCLISHIVVYFGLPMYHGIIGITISPFILVPP
jgi:hypothetical protein